MIQQSASQQRQLFDRQIKSGRLAILLIVIATVINIIVLFAGATFYFYLTSALPYYLFFLSGLFCGVFSESMYTELGVTKAEMTVLSPGTFAAAAAFALAVLVFFLVCWFFCQKNRGWFLAAIIAEAIDAVGLILPLFVFEDSVIILIMGLVFHGFMVYWIALAYRAEKKRALLPAEEAPAFTPLMTAEPVEGADPTVPTEPAAPAKAAEAAAKPEETSASAETGANADTTTR